MAKRIFVKRNYKGKLVIAIFVVFVIAVIYGFSIAQAQLSEADVDRRVDFVQSAVMRSVVQCYALETRYPPSLKYLQQHYGLAVDEDKYIYYFQSQGDNRMPIIKVLLVN